MIRLKMGSEPQKLRDERNKRLPLAIAAFNAHGHGTREFKKTLAGYDVVKDSLRQKQHGKCAFCERNEDPFNQPVEHFRPKAAADDFAAGKWTGRVTTHYWWLTWTWSNLLFACDDCNRTGSKGNRFPIETGQVRVVAPVRPLARLSKSHFDVSNEPALLINPRLEDPFEHIEWMPVNRKLPKKSWTWEMIGRTPRGKMTIEAIDLKFRTDEVNRHLRTLLNAWIAVDDAVKRRHWRDARRYWLGLIRTYLSDREQPFRNAAWWALDSLCPELQRQQWGFATLRKPTG